MTKFRNIKSNKNQGIHTIFGQHSVKAALHNDKREQIELCMRKHNIDRYPSHSRNACEHERQRMQERMRLVLQRVQ